MKALFSRFIRPLWQDPFRNVLWIYNTLVIIVVVLLLTLLNDSEYYYFEEILSEEMDNELEEIERVRLDEGPEAVLDWVRETETTPYHFIYLNDDQQAQSPGDTLEFEFDAEEDAYIVYNPEKNDSDYLILENGWGENNNETLIIAIDESRHQNQYLWFRLAIIGFILLLLLSSIGMYTFVRGIRRRLEIINQHCQQIMQSGDLSLRLNSTHLSGPLKKTTLQLNRLLHQVEQTMVINRQQAANIAHDLRTPLTSVYNRIQQLAEKDPQLEPLENMLQQLTHTFNQLLRINRLESLTETVPVKKIDIAHLIENVSELYAPVLEERQQKLSIDILCQKVNGNQELLTQILVNLIDNASKYSPSDSSINLSTWQQKQYIHIRIQDQSGGVDEEQLDKLCQRFYRTDQSRGAINGEVNGNGLGLSFVKAAAESMAGTISISNRPYQKKMGLCVEIILAAEG